VQEKSSWHSDFCFVLEVSCSISFKTHGTLKIHLFVVVIPKNISDSIFKNPESSADQQ